MSNRSQSRTNSKEPHRNTIGMERRELEGFLDRIDSMVTPEAAASSRAHTRLPIYETRINVCIIEADQTRRCMTMASRDISNGGISLLHSCYLHPGSRCSITLPAVVSSGTEAKVVEGKIVKCVHRSGMVHEIGICFDELIDASTYAVRQPSADHQTLSTDTRNLSGTILHIEDSHMDSRLVEHYLSSSSVKIIKAHTFEEARSLAQAPIDLILCDMMMPDGTPQDFVSWLRNQRIATPLVLHTASPVVHVRQQMKDLEIQGLMLKPMLRNAFLNAMGEFLGRPSVPIERALLSGPEVAPMARAEAAKLFSSELTHVVTGIARAIAEDDPMTLYTLSVHLGHTARSVGFDALAEAATKAAKQMATTMSCKESAQEIQGLINSCRTARAA